MKTPDQKLAASRLWKQQHPERHAELAVAYRARNREKTKAQNQLNYALRMGTMQRGACEKCGTTERVHAHHDDYRKPYEVHWLCYLCHKAQHPVRDVDKKIKFAGAKHASLPGEDNPNAALTNAQAEQIRVMLAARVPQARIAAAFGVHQCTVSRIKRGIRYTQGD